MTGDHESLFRATVCTLKILLSVCTLKVQGSEAELLDIVINFGKLLDLGF